MTRSLTSSHLAIGCGHSDEEDGADAGYDAENNPLIPQIVGDEAESQNTDETDHVSRNCVVCRACKSIGS